MPRIPAQAAAVERLGRLSRVDGQSRQAKMKRVQLLQLCAQLPIKVS